MTTYEQRCRRGQFCAARFDWNGPAPAARPLCDRDTDELDRVLRELVELLPHVRAVALAALPGRASGDRTGGGSVEAPLPFRADLDELADLIGATVGEWASYVAVVARILGPPPGKHQAGRALQVAVAILRPHLSVLLALQPRAVRRLDETVAMDGGDAALELFALHHRTRAVLGRTNKVLHLPWPCPSTVIDEDESERICGVRALERYDGYEQVVCSSCGAQTTMDDHQPLEESA